MFLRNNLILAWNMYFPRQTKEEHSNELLMKQSFLLCMKRIVVWEWRKEESWFFPSFLPFFLLFLSFLNTS